MYLAKPHRIHLKGKKLKALQDAVYERDGGCCIVCHRYIREGWKFHHEPPGQYRSDEINKAVMLCQDCHFKRHNSGKEAVQIQKACETYLQGIYGEKGAKKE